MTNSKKIQDIIQNAIQVPVCSVSTFAGNKIRSRMTHFAATGNGDFYIATTKNDPKIKQIILNRSISLLIYVKGEQFSEDVEIEVNGIAAIENDKTSRAHAIELLKSRSPIVAQLSEINQLDMIDFIKISPIVIKKRVVSDVLQGKGPAVIEFERAPAGNSEWQEFKKKVKAWVIETRYPFLTVSIIPLLLGTLIAWKESGNFNLGLFILTLLGVLLLHIGTNIINDYFDHKSGNDARNKEFVRPFSGGSRMIQSGILSPLEVLAGALLFFMFGIGIGVFLVFKLGYVILFLGLIGVASGFLYSAPKLNFANKGLGEIVVGLDFGLLISFGAYFVQAHRFSGTIFWAVLPLSLLVSSILYINEFPDYTADAAVDKKTLVVRMGRKKAADFFAYLILSPFVILAFGVVLGKIPIVSLGALLAVPLALTAVKYAKKFFDKPFDLAPGNGFTLLAFDIAGFFLLLAFSIGQIKMAFVVAFVLIAIWRIASLFSKIRKQKNIALKLKELYE